MTAYARESEVSVRIPADDAAAWDPWLTTELGVQAEKFDLGYDGGESYGKFEVFDFWGDPAQVERAVVVGLDAHGVHRAVTRKKRKITVAPDPGPPLWLVTHGPQDSEYEKAVRRVIREVSADESLAQWFAETGLTKIRFHESHDPGRPARFPGQDHQDEGELYLMHYTDLTLVDEDPKPTKDEAERVAREHVREILEAVADHLGKPLPTAA